MAANPISLAPDDEFAELLDDFLASQLSPLTRSSYAGDLTIFLGWLAGRGKHPRDVSRPDIDRYRNWLAELDRARRQARRQRPRALCAGDDRAQALRGARLLQLSV